MNEQQTPTPIDPADIRAGDVVDLYYRATICQVFPSYVVSEDGTHWVKDAATTTWHLVSRPDPDAEAVEALREAMFSGPSDTSGLPYVRDVLQELRERGWDVVRRAES